MALIESVHIKPGTVMPDFSLPDTSGKSHSAYKKTGKNGLLIVFTCNHCPYALAVWPRLIKLSALAKTLGVETIAVNPNIHPDYPADAPDMMAKKVKEWGIPFPYLVDETQEVARLYNAQCTPDVYLLDKQHTLVYHGRIDDNWKEEHKVTRHELQEAVEALAAQRPVASVQYPSMGCSIKWRH